MTKEKIKITCKECGKELFIKPCLKDRKKYCSIKCRGIWRSKNYINSDETRKKISKANMGRCVSEETRKKIGLFHKGKFITEKQKEKYRNSMKEKYKLGYINPQKNKVLTDKTKKKISESVKEKIKNNPDILIKAIENKKKYYLNRTEEEKQKHSEKRKIIALQNSNYGMKNKNHTEETKLKISNSLKEKYKKGEIVSPFKNMTKKNGNWKGGVSFLSEKSREKIREKRLKQRFPVKDTSIEVLMKSQLEKLGLIKDFEQHKPIFKQWQADFVSEKYKIIIECDGDYWHANPDKYDRHNIGFFQQKRVKRDEEINSFINNNTDYMLLRFWESQINTDIEGIGNFILNMCNRGELEC